MVKGGQLDDAVKLLQQSKNGEFKENAISHAVSKSEISKNSDYNLSGERYKSQVILNSDYPIVELKEVAKVISGQSPKGEYYNDEGIGIAFYQGKTDFGERYIGSPTKWTTETTKEAFKDDILMSVRAPVGPINFATQHCCIGRGLAAIRIKDSVINDFLFYLLKSKENQIKGSGGAVFDSISRNQIEAIKIPLPPLHIQEEIVAEIEGYQKIIDGAKMVVENYSPQIKIDPEWEMVELGKLATFVQGINTAVDKLNYVSSGVKVLQANNIYLGSVNYDKLKFITREEYVTISPQYKPTINDVLYSNIGARFGYASILENEEPCTFSWNVLRLIINDFSKVDKYYLKNILNTDFLRKNILSKSSTSTMPFISGKELKLINIPLPSIAIQRQIVAQIEKVQGIVNANKELIEIFEQKIKDKIGEVWGED